MPSIKYHFGDTFSFPGGYGVMISETETVLVFGKGGRTGWVVRKGIVPDGAIPHRHEQLPIEVQMAVLGALAALM